MKAASLLLAYCLLTVTPTCGAPAGGGLETPVMAPVPETKPKTAIPLTLSSPTRDSSPRIDCVLPVKRVGAVQLEDAQAVIRNGTVEIRSKFTTGQSEPYLTGHVLRQDDSGTSNGADGLRQMSGIVLFRAGMMFSQLTEAPPQLTDQSLQTLQTIQSSPPVQSMQSELVFRNDGAGAVNGQIIDVRGSQLLMRDRTGMVTVPLSAISYVRSPRAFLFTITGKPSSDQTHTTVQNITFQPTLNASGLQNQVVIGRPADSLDDLDDVTEPIIPRNKPLIEEAEWQQPLPGRRPFPSWP